MLNTQDQYQPPVIVLGMHRSGTSLLMGSLEAAGVRVGEVNNYAPHNRKGNKEHTGIRDLNDRILTRHLGDWKLPPVDQLPLAWTDAEKHEAASLCKSLAAAGEVWGFKDPRTVWTLEGWLDVSGEARMIGVFRHPGAVIRSLIARPGALALSPAEAWALWTKTNERLLALSVKFDFPLLQFTQHSLSRSFMTPLASFSRSLGLEGNPESFYAVELVHQAEFDTELEAEQAALMDRLLRRSEISLGIV